MCLSTGLGAAPERIPNPCDPELRRSRRRGRSTQPTAHRHLTVPGGAWSRSPVHDGEQSSWGNVHHDRSEMEVLFALLAERYERRSVMITFMWNWPRSPASRAGQIRIIHVTCE